MPDKQQTILLIEDNSDLQRINRCALELCGYNILQAYTLLEAEDILEGHTPDLILLDIMMPDGNGINFCRTLRRTSKIPILFLSALDRNADIIAGLASGGDDYLSKPYDLNVLAAKVQAMMRRIALDTSENQYCHNGFKMDFTTRQAYWQKEIIPLKPKEYAILEYLVNHRTQFVPSSKLYCCVWHMEAQSDIRTVKTHIYSLRAKLRKYPSLPFCIVWQRNRGYRYLENGTGHPSSKGS
ncbi:MAG: response regulator transcription factor [Clostridiales bacterium]|nr:response regulator transcription factor [Clostridiales bacterium]